MKIVMFWMFPPSLSFFLLSVIHMYIRSKAFTFSHSLLEPCKMKFTIVCSIIVTILAATVIGSDDKAITKVSLVLHFFKYLYYITVWVGQAVVFPLVQISVDPRSELFVPPGVDAKLWITIYNHGANDVFSLSGEDEEYIFVGFDDSK